MLTAPESRLCPFVDRQCGGEQCWAWLPKSGPWGSKCLLLESSASQARAASQLARVGASMEEFSNALTPRVAGKFAQLLLGVKPPKDAKAKAD